MVIHFVAVLGRDLALFQELLELRLGFKTNGQSQFTV
jgi:hypothetical protein